MNKHLVLKNNVCIDQKNVWKIGTFVVIFSFSDNISVVIFITASLNFLSLIFPSIIWSDCNDMFSAVVFTRLLNDNFNERRVNRLSD